MILSDISSLVGKPYESGSHGPETFDCWGLVVYIYSNLLGIELPKFAGYESKTLFPKKIRQEIARPNSSWEELEVPEPYSVVAMGRTRTVNHVGIWIPINNGLCLHSVENESVLAQTIQGLRIYGFGKIKFYRYRND